MRKYLSSILLALTLPVGELHRFWINDTRIQNWIIAVPRPMLISWNMKYLEGEIIPIMYFAAWMLWQPNKVNRTTVAAMFCIACFDLLLYFYNYKVSGFGSVYFWFIGFWLIAYKFWKHNNKSR